MMNIELIKKYRAEFDWWMEDYHKRSVMVKECGGKWKEDNDPFCIWRKSYRSADNYKLVINDEYAKFRMAEADGEIIEYLLTDKKYPPCDEWKLVSKIVSTGGTVVNCLSDLINSTTEVELRIKPAWKWQDEISESKPVICFRGDGVDHATGYNSHTGAYHLDFSPNDEIIDRPITAADLHPFQRVGYYSIEELEPLVNEYFSTVGTCHGKPFIKWLKEKEAKA